MKENSNLLHKIEEWRSIYEPPPFNEVEALRLLDWMMNAEEKAVEKSDLIKAKLKTMIAYYRIRRNQGNNRITEKILKEAENMQPGSRQVADLKSVMAFGNFYRLWEKVSLREWALRETDFEPAKLKKITSLEEELIFLYETGEKIQNQDSEGERNETEELFIQAMNDVESFIRLLHQSAEAIRNKRTSLPVHQLNQSAKSLTEKRKVFFEALPTGYKPEPKINPLEKLNRMAGLKNVKKYIREYYHYLKYQQERNQLGFSVADEPGLHMIISGNPGTGKTTIARLLSEIYHELGLLETSRVTEVNRSHLVGSYLGQSEENTMNYVKESLGGILFIDEAYNLKREGQTGNDYGQAVIDTLVSSMTSKEFGENFAVILAGYPEEMRQFLWANPGMRSRFPGQNQVELPDFTTEELLQIAESAALDNDYFFTEEALASFKDLIEQERVDETFGNARTVRDLVLKIIFNKGARKGGNQTGHWLEHMKITRGELSREEKTEEKPMAELDNLIGLSNVKQEVKKLSSFVRVQQVRKKEGRMPVPIQLHAIFSGNPGTGKTTVAKVYSRILNECGLLKRGHLVIASRSDLVAGYVGQTALKTKQKVREALGGVLFIDEAYALYRGEKDFGKEAIDTLVDEMTRHNENLVVVLAGYGREMESFINSNPGLQSRFKKYFHFHDFSADELVEITRYQTGLYGYIPDKNAIEYLENEYRNNSISGNARFVVNLVDESIQFQALRIMESDDNLDGRELQRLRKEDIQQAWNVMRGKKIEKGYHTD